MPIWRMRDFHDDDLDQVVQVWDQSRTDDQPAPLFPISEAMSAARSGQPAVVAVVGEEIVGVAVARAEGDRAWILLVALAAARHRQQSAGGAGPPPARLGGAPHLCAAPGVGHRYRGAAQLRLRLARRPGLPLILASTPAFTPEVKAI
jgi:hypothetical protein